MHSMNRSPRCLFPLGLRLWPGGLRSEGVAAAGPCAVSLQPRGVSAMPRPQGLNSVVDSNTGVVPFFGVGTPFLGSFEGKPFLYAFPPLSLRVFCVYFSRGSFIEGCVVQTGKKGSRARPTSVNSDSPVSRVGSRNTDLGSPLIVWGAQ